MVGSEPSYWNSREGEWDYGRKSRRLGALSLWSKVTQSTLSPGDSFLIQWLTWVWNLLQLFAFTVQRRRFRPCNHPFPLLPFLVRNSCEFKQQRWKSHCVIYPNHPLITRKVQLHCSWMFPVHWQPLIWGGKPQNTSERVLTHRDEGHVYVLSASGSVSTDELTRVDHCRSRRPAWTLSPIGHEGVSAAATVCVYFSVSCNNIRGSLLSQLSDSLVW